MSDSTRRRSAALLADHRGREAADLLARALTRDMSGVQSTILNNPEQNRHAFDPPYEANDLVALAFDIDARDAGARQTRADVLTDPDVLVELVGVVPIREPVGLPWVDDPETEPVRVDLVTHYASSPNERTTSVMCDVRFRILVARP